MPSGSGFVRFLLQSLISAAGISLAPFNQGNFMSLTIRIHFTLQAAVPAVPGSTNLRTIARDGPDYVLITAGDQSDFDYWIAHLDAAAVPYTVAAATL
jgi:hypothetical protein